MWKKKYYNYRKYSKNKEPGLFESLAEFILLVSVFGWILNLVYKKKVDVFLSTYLPSIKFYFFIIIWVLASLLVIVLIILIFKKYFKKSKIINDNIDNEELNKILAEIKSFKQLRNHSSETQHHMEIAGFLKKTFPDLEIEQTSWNTRPDIVISNVAIEIKWPTTSSWLQTLADKIIRYLKHYEYIIVILFNVEVSREDFLEWKTDIIENFSHKWNRIYIIDK